MESNKVPPKSTRLRQLRLLLWKNYTLQKRRPIATAFEIGLPTFFFLLLLVIRRITDHGGNLQCTDGRLAPDGTNYTGCYYDPLQATQIISNYDTNLDNCSTWLIGYSPNTADANVLISQLNGTFDLQHAKYPAIFQAYDDEVELVTALGLLAGVNPACRAGIVFDELDLANKKVSYSLRFDSHPGGVGGKTNGDNDMGNWMTDQAFPFFQDQGPRNPKNSNLDPSPGYLPNGFVLLQSNLDRAIARYATGSNATVDNLYEGLKIVRMPYPTFKKDGFVYALQFGMPLLLMLSLLFSALSIVRNLVFEKEKRLKESMKMMGLKNWIHWLAWFIEYFLFLMISMIIICVILAAGKIIPNSDISLIFVFLMMFAIATISFCFLMSVFFSKAQTGAAVAGILWFCSYVPYFFIAARFNTLSAQTKSTSCLLSTTCMALGANVLATMEADGSGVRWSNFAKPPSVDDNFAFGSVMAMFVFDTFFYLFLAWYIEAVFPGEFGIARKWYFPFTMAYWCGDDKKPEKEGLLGAKEEELGVDRNNFEREPTDRRAGIDIRNLRKVFDSKVAVANTSVKLFEGQITALLGHNGAGKTTTMSMLTGLFAPTSGTAYIDGYDIRTNINAAQQSLGICPQHDVLFDTLTVEEHLWFFCKLKGVPDIEVPKHINDMIRDLEIMDKRKTFSKDLSGGMKRKLSCAIALVGGSKVVILDEPTSGMDPSARRATWDLLSKHKEGRTMLLSTHFMDEADLLGDRIAIMSDGVVRCCGSSMFLKRRFGEGYHLTIAKSAGSDSNRISSFLLSLIPDARVELDVGAELTFILPRGSVDKFENLFAQLEAKKSEFGIESYGASITTMEEVFLKVGEGTAGAAEERVDIQSRLEKRKRNRQEHHIQDNGDAEALLGHDNARLQTGFKLKRQQFYAMIVKRFYHSRRDKYAIVSQLLMPMLFTIIAMILIKTFPPGTDSKSRQLTNLADNYGYNKVIYLSGLPEAGITPSNVSNALVAGIAPVLGRYGSSQDSLQATMDISLFAISIAGSSPPDVARFNREVLVGLNFYSNDTNIGAFVLFNGQAFHTPAESINLFSNVVLQTFAPDWTINARNFPLPRTTLEQAKDQQDSQMGFTISFNILFGMAFLASSFVLFLVAERTNKAKHIQFVSGVDVFSYWGSSFLWDYINYLVPTFTIIVLFPIFGVDEYSGGRAGYVLLLFLLYGFAVIPLMHLASFLFMSASIAYTRLTMFNIATGLGTLLTISILSILDPDTAESLKGAFLFLPNYCFGQGLSDIYTNYQYQELLKPIISMFGNELTLTEVCDLGADEISKILAGSGVNVDFSCNTDYFGMRSPGIGKYVLGLLFQGFAFFALVILAEYQVFDRLRGKLFPLTSQSGQSDVDADVNKERERVRSQIQTLQLNKSTRGNELESSTDEPDIVLIEGLTKVYRTGSMGCGKEKLAVDNITVGIPRSECFGLLGVNGAGKTTTFRMLTGDLEMTRGVAYMDGFNTATEKTQVRQRIGYCPQFDGLIDLLTGREMLTMYARLRGVPESSLTAVVDDLIESLMLEKHADKYTKTYSGGNKRKLSTAVALVGSPPIVFLDEPTTGMDPGARRFLWDSLINARREGRSIVLTSHSMEECEALCTRLAIMVNGQFQCLGSPQHLKNKFGKGIAVSVKLQDAGRTEELRLFVSRTFPQVEIKEEHQGMVKFMINGNVAWSNVFGMMERARAQFNLEDYSVSQPTLEQIFLDFAKHQIEEELKL